MHSLLNIIDINSGFLKKWNQIRVESWKVGVGASLADAQILRLL